MFVNFTDINMYLFSHLYKFLIPILWRLIPIKRRNNKSYPRVFQKIPKDLPIFNRNAEKIITMRTINTGYDHAKVSGY